MKLDLIPLDREYLTAVLERRARPDLGFIDPHGFLDGALDVVAMRRDQLDFDPELTPWLLRAMVLREDGTAIGFIGFHSGPDPDRAVEIGYEVLPDFRRRGYAREAAETLMAWAKTQDVRVIRASVAPDNTGSLAMMTGLGFVQTGEHVDEIDGRELEFERAP